MRVGTQLFLSDQSLFHLLNALNYRPTMFSIQKKWLIRLLFASIGIALLSNSHTFSQENVIDIRSVMNSIATENREASQNLNDITNWWHEQIAQSQRDSNVQTHVSQESLLLLALKNSAQIKVYKDVPLIRETAIQEANAAFDWNHYLDTLWEDIDEPVGSSLTVGGNGDRYKNHNFSATGGMRKKTLYGSEVDISQRLGHQNTNSNFFVPNDQGTTQLSLGFTQPLLRGRGKTYNESLIVLAKIDVETARQEFSRQLQSHLLQVAQGYWSLYLERGVLAQKVKLYLKTIEIVQQLEARARIDAAKSQIISANAALVNRRSELIRAQAAVQNAETRLRALINAKALGKANTVELVPVERPISTTIPIDYSNQVALAVQNRPEIAAAIKGVKAGAIRLQMAKHEMLPILNLITRTYVSGLQGESDIGRAWLDQFNVGAPSYTIGLQYEVPIGRRAANSRLSRRMIEVRQLKEKYRSALENVNAEVEIAVREVETANRELIAKQQALNASVAEAQTIEARWKRVVGGDGTASLNLESLLRAQGRVTESESALLQSQLTYNLAIINLKRVNGTLLQIELFDEKDFANLGLTRQFPIQVDNTNNISNSTSPTVSLPLQMEK